MFTKKIFFTNGRKFLNKKKKKKKKKKKFEPQN